jgi:hypothetical protein
MLEEYYPLPKDKERIYLAIQSGFFSKMAQLPTHQTKHKIGVERILMNFWIRIIGLRILLT